MLIRASFDFYPEKLLFGLIHSLNFYSFKTRAKATGQVSGFFG